MKIAALFFLVGTALGIIVVVEISSEAKAFVVTAYCPCEICCGKWSKIGVNAKGQRVTASGHIIQPGDKFVAAPPGYAFGTRIFIPGYGKVKVRDRGGAIKDNKLDIYLPTHKEALQWGRRTLVCKVY